MILTVEKYLDSAKHSLSYWEEKKLNPKNDGTLPDSCYHALIKHKIKVFGEVVAYLESLPKGTVLTTDRGKTKEGCMYFELVNK